MGNSKQHVPFYAQWKVNRAKMVVVCISSFMCNGRNGRAFTCANPTR